jgi:hypothetical protein
MSSLSELGHLAVKVSETLAGLLGVDPADIDLRSDDPSGADFVVTAGMTFVIEFKKTTSAAVILAAANRVREMTGHVRRPGVPLIAVPYMGEVGRKVCAETGVGWLDLSGNARIIAPGIRVIVEGRPNRYRSAGRPPNLFAPKSSRIVRWLLIHHGEHLSQRSLARATGLDEGFVSRLVARLLKEEYLARDGQGSVYAKDPWLMLEAWREAYRFSQHTLHQGHIAARSGDALLRFVSDTLVEQRIEHAATGLGAAWVFLRHTAFRVASIYLLDDPSPALRERLGYREDPRGANLWFVIPRDAGVLQGAVEKDGIRCVHPVQVYVDLKDHPERAAEAAEHLRTELLSSARDGG